ncbi:unnamed protein product [Callosobruchus maculatus]|uniref:Uncharacterized protein n=1 Tax=Callosobruchus maculatus TaxID=64391 RepID=A0A653CHT6_CALMS|nr:unnamed protein product [Callosobruchus maculatus]
MPERRRTPSTRPPEDRQRQASRRFAPTGRCVCLSLAPSDAAGVCRAAATDPPTPAAFKLQPLSVVIVTAVHPSNVTHVHSALPAGPTRFTR